MHVRVLVCSSDGDVEKNSLMVEVADDAIVGTLAKVVAKELNLWATQVTIWKPLRSITEATVTNAKQLESQLGQHDDDLAGFCENLSETHIDDTVKSIQEVASSTRASVLPLVASWEPRLEKRKAAKERTQKEPVDVVSELRNDYRKTVKIAREGKRPSANAKSVNYNDRQKDVPILDGRYPDGFGPTVSPPVEFYHPVFPRFLKNVNDPNLNVPVDVVQHTAKMMKVASKIATSEKQRERNTRQFLADLLSHGVTQGVNHDKTSANHLVITSRTEEPPEVGLILLAEEKSEIGSSGDAAVQAVLSYLSYWSDPSRNRLRDLGCCPSFAVGIAGPWLVIMGCVFTSNVIAHKLTDYLWIGNSRVIDDAVALRLARIFQSLRLAVDELREYYLRLPSTTPKDSRFYPSITSYPSDTGTVDFRYLKPLESDKSCVTFLAEVLSSTGNNDDEDREQIVVKFVERYGKAVHELLASNGLAPGLLYYGNISNDAKLHYGGRSMVVMEFIRGRAAHEEWADERVPDAVRERMFEAVDLLHGQSLVHGDLRKTNFMIQDGEGAPEDRVKIIDFDWAGREDEVRYPLHLSKAVFDMDDIEDYKLIKHEHDLAMVARL